MTEKEESIIEPITASVVEPVVEPTSSVTIIDDYEIEPALEPVTNQACDDAFFRSYYKKN